MIWILLILFVLCGYGYYDLRKRISSIDINLTKVDDRLESANIATNINFKSLHTAFKVLKRQNDGYDTVILKVKKDIKEIQKDLE